MQSTTRPSAMEPVAGSERWRQNKQRWQNEFAIGATVLRSRPSWITFDPASVCNLRCVQCPRQHPNSTFQEHRADPMLFERLRDSLPSLERLTLYGLGEPLLSDLFWAIVEDEATAQVPMIDINTNGTLLTARNVDRLLNAHLTWIKVSIDAATPDTFRRIRGGSLQNVVTGVRRLTARRREVNRTNLHISIGMTLMLENIRELPAMIELSQELGADAFWAQHLQMRGDGSSDDWRVERHGWTFVYDEQHLSNAPALSNAMVRRARAIADGRDFYFQLDPELWLPE